MTLCQSAVIFFQRPFPLSAFALKFLFHCLPESLTGFVVLSDSLATFLHFNCKPHETHSGRKGIAAFPSANTFVAFLALLDPTQPIQFSVPFSQFLTGTLIC